MAVIRFTPYGWRGRYDEDFNEENVVRIAAGLGGAWTRRGVGGRVYVGYDGRYRGEAFALLAGSTLASFGLEVKVARGVCPLPLFAVCDDIRLLYEDTVDGRHGLGQLRNYLHRAAGGELLARCREEAVRPVPALAEFSACDPQLRYSCREPEPGAFPGI